MTSFLRAIGMGIAAGIIIGLVAGWRLWHPDPRPAVVESAAPAVVLHNGVQEIARQPAASVPEAITEAAHEISPKAKVARTISFNVAPKVIEPKPTDTVPMTDKNAVTTPIQCASVHVDAAVIDLPDGSHRVVIKSDGKISDAVDIPGFNPAAVKDTKWAVGGLYDVTDHSYGAFVDRDLGPFRAGIDMVRIASNNTFKVVARIGIRF